MKSLMSNSLKTRIKLLVSITFQPSLQTWTNSSAEIREANRSRKAVVGNLLRQAARQQRAEAGAHPVPVRIDGGPARAAGRGRGGGRRRGAGGAAGAARPGDKGGDSTLFGDRGGDSTLLDGGGTLPGGAG
jgi:hypothetical protein